MGRSKKKKKKNEKKSLEKKKGWTTECIILWIICIKNHTNWLMPIGARVCNLSPTQLSAICYGSVGKFTFLVHTTSSTGNCMYLWLCPSFLEWCEIGVRCPSPWLEAICSSVLN